MRKLQVLGAGCPKCDNLAKNADAAARSAGIEYELTKVSDLAAILAFGVLMTPALVIDGEVRAVGKVPTAEEIRQMLG